MIAGITRHKWQDNLINAIALLGFSIPVFWLALLLTLFCSLTLGWLPVSGRFDLLYEVKPITGFALIDAWLSDSPWRDEDDHERNPPYDIARDHPVGCANN